LCLLVVLLTLTSVVALTAAEPVGADPSGDDQAKQHDLGQRQAQINGQLNLLEASDVQLQAEVDRLAGLLKQQQDKLEQAKADLAKVTHQLDGLQASVDQARQDAESAKHRLQERAINAYMHPGIDDAAALLEASDYDQAHRRRTMLGEVAKYDDDVLAGSQAAQHQLEARQEQLADAQRQADQLKQDAEDDLADINAARDRQVLAKQQLDQRIAGMKSEAQELAASQAELTRIIQERATPAPAPQEVAAPPPTSAAAKAPTETQAPAAKAPAPTTTSGPTSTSKPTPTPSFSLAWPVSGPITSPFGPRWGTHHDGIDIAVNLGTPIHAAASGTIIYCGQISGYGNVDMIDHHNGFVTLYAHQSQLNCTMGQSVSTGQVVGYSGNTGHSTGPHLHFEVRYNSVAVDPMRYLP
jgi:murein DD-endopeptidase MepM/ murein hydrolase activator NlpD